jgi:hypothetical protein
LRPGGTPASSGRSPATSQRSAVARLAEEKGLVIVSPDALTLRRQRRGKGFAFLTKTGALVRDKAAGKGVETIH